MELIGGFVALAAGVIGAGLALVVGIGVGVFVLAMALVAAAFFLVTGIVGGLLGIVFGIVLLGVKVILLAALIAGGVLVVRRLTNSERPRLAA